MSEVANVIAVALVICGGLTLVIALFGILSFFVRMLGEKLFRDLRRVYHLRVIGYWLDRLEAVGVREFERAEQHDWGQKTDLGEPK
jgi:hypothetical protein